MPIPVVRTLGSRPGVKVTLRDDEDGGVLRRGLAGRHPGGARVQDGHLHWAPRHREDKAPARRDEPASVQEEPGPRGVGSGYGKTAPPPQDHFLVIINTRRWRARFSGRTLASRGLLSLRAVPGSVALLGGIQLISREPTVDRLVFCFLVSGRSKRGIYPLLLSVKYFASRNPCMRRSGRTPKDVLWLEATGLLYISSSLVGGMFSRLGW